MDAATMSLCVDACDPTACCFAQFIYISSLCTVMKLQQAVSNDYFQLHYKLTPSDPITMFKLQNDTTGGVNSKYVGSLGYQACATIDWINGLASNASAQIGTSLEGYESVMTGMTTLQCSAACDRYVGCWGFLYTPNNGGQCLMRSGRYTEHTRSFFAVPMSEPTSEPAMQQGM